MLNRSAARWASLTLAVYPCLVAALPVVLPVVQPRSGQLALVAILAMHVALAALVAGLADAHREVGLGPGWTWRPSRFEGLGLGLLRIDLALSGPGASPTRVGERCGLPGDHCQLHATFALEAS